VRRRGGGCFLRAGAGRAAWPPCEAGGCAGSPASGRVAQAPGTDRPSLPPPPTPYPPRRQQLAGARIGGDEAPAARGQEPAAGPAAKKARVELPRGGVMAVVAVAAPAAAADAAGKRGRVSAS
jgi:hypothetical protein